MPRLARYLTPLALALVAGCTRDEVRWSPPRLVTAETGGGAAPMFATAADGKRALAWVSAPAAGTAGRLYVEVAGQVSELRDPLGDLSIYGEVPPKIAFGSDGALNAAWVVVKALPGHRWPLQALRFARSADGGRTWSEPVTVTDDSVFAAHDDHALLAGADGTLYLTWLDMRSGKSHVYLSRSTDQGRTWEANRPIRVEEACPCCRTALASGPDGRLYVAWRGIFRGEVRDIVVARSDDEGRTWSAPVRVHEDGWVVHACPDAGPSLAVGRDGRVHVAWWTGKEGRAGVQYAVAPAGAGSFSAPVPLGLAEFSRPAHVQIALTGQDVVFATWDDGTLKQPAVVARVSRDGGRTFAPAMRLSSGGRSAGYPVVSARDSAFTVAWQEQDTVAATQAMAERARRNPTEAASYVSSVGALHVALRDGVLR